MPLQAHLSFIITPLARACRTGTLVALISLLVSACATSPTQVTSSSGIEGDPSITAQPPMVSTSKAGKTPGGAVTRIPEAALAINTIDLTTPAADVWQRMRIGFSMPDLHSPLVADRQAWYLNHPEQLRIMMQRSHRYLYHIVNELQKRGMPTELALLPMVESSYNPKAASSAKALGIWQFIPSTGKSYGLENNWYLDERRDIISSTDAALVYLQKIYERHGDWHLALASYNWGEGAVGRAIAKNQALGLRTDYANLTLPEETRYYVPKLQALKNIIADPELFGISLAPVPNNPYFATIDTTSTMDVATAARLAEISVDEFNALNPAYHRQIIPGNSDSLLVLPTGKVAAFKTNLALYQDQDKPLSRWRTIKPKRGESLLSIAKRNRVSLAYLKQLNGIGRNTRVSNGNPLLLPTGSSAKETASANNIREAPRKAKSVKRSKAATKPKATKKATAKKKASSPPKSTPRKVVPKKAS